MNAIEQVLTIRLADGRKLAVRQKNLGYIFGGYETRFRWDEGLLITHFKSEQKTRWECPHPDLRLAYDLEQLEAAIGQPITIESENE